MSKMAVIYWSASGNTEAMAAAICQGADDAGAEAVLRQVSEISQAQALDYPLLALGCPAMGDEVLEESEFDPFFTDLEGQLGGKAVALFGSYGWGDCQWMRDWEQRVRNAGAVLYQDEGLTVNETPDEPALEMCRQFGAGFAREGT